MLPAPIWPLAEHASLGQNCCDASIGSVVLFCISTSCRGPSLFSIPSPLHRLVGSYQSPVITLLCGLTDSFWAQAQVNRLALHLGIPSLCAQQYQYGQAAEITFTYPGVTPACHRCMLNSRYK